MTEDGLPDFSGKVVYVQPPCEGHCWTLVDTHFERQGGKWYLIGKPIVCKDKPHWSDKGAVGIQWKYVAFYVVFNSFEEYEASTRRAEMSMEESKTSRHGWLRRQKSH